MRSAMRVLVASLPVTVAAVVMLMFAAPDALAGGGPRTVTFVTQPTTTQVNTAMTPAVTVDVEDAWGNPVSCTACVTLTYFDSTNTLGQPEPTNNTANAVNGVATFPGLTFSAPGFNFELQASVKKATSSPSQPFDIVTQLVQCQPGKTCQSGTVSSAGTSGSAVASAASTSDVLTATGGGFPQLSCTTYGGVLTFIVTNRSKIITLTLAASIAEQANKKFFDICWGSPTPFITKNGSTSKPANNEYEGLLPLCRLGGPSPCIIIQFWKLGAVVTAVFAPAGDPHSSF